MSSFEEKSIFQKNFEEDSIFDLALRPQKWEDFIGQEKIKENLKILLEAAKKRKEVPEHILFYGPPGLGKTTLSYLIAKELSQPIRITSGPTIEKMADLASILSSLNPGEILFIDEIHRLNKNIEEVLYPAMESRVLNLVVGKGVTAKVIQIKLSPFTLVGATTRFALLSSPLRSRFGAIFRLDFYENEEIEKIIERSSLLLKTEIEEEGKKFLARVSRGIPRVANRLLKRVRDYAQVNNSEKITKEIIKKTLELIEIDEVGLEAADRKILEVLIKKFNGGPVGIKTIAAAVNEEKETIEEIYEPFLMRLGFLERTPKGRMVTPAAYKHLGIKEKNLKIF
ncbi:Holliday junction branch migration DNA helicase RuvB [bacterium]|nr:Holliday junction branch migration DNA helicase RuvB [bacterium]